MVEVSIQGTERCGTFMAYLLLTGDDISPQLTVYAGLPENDQLLPYCFH